MLLRVGRVGLPSPRRLGGAVAWTPASISAPVWLDVSDLSTMFQERTGAGATTAAAVDAVVGSRFNKGTLGGWAVCASDAQRPILRTDGAGHYWLEYDGTNDNFVMPSSVLGLFRNVANAMIAAATRLSDNAAAKTVAAWTVGGAASTRCSLSANSSEHYQLFARRNDGDSSANVTYGTALTTDKVVRGHADFGNSDAYLYVDGVQQASSTSFLTSGNTADTDSQGAYIGTFNGSSNPMVGREYGIVAGVYAYNHADMAALDTYLGALQGRTI